MIYDHGTAHLMLFRQRQALVHEKLDNTEDDALCKIDITEGDLIEFRASYDRALESYDDRRKYCSKDIKKLYELAQTTLKTQIVALEHIATIAKIDLKAASEDWVSNGIPFCSTKAAHESHVDSDFHSGRGRGSRVIGPRGGRGGLCRGNLGRGYGS
jgi:hypothetical protein